MAPALDANEQVEEAQRRVGRILKGKWRLDRVLGVGGTASVYEAAHHGNLGRVAVKIMHERLARTPGQQARFRGEGRAANRVGHPGVPVVYDDDDDDGTPFLVMELLEGRTVAEHAADCGGKLPPERVLGITEQLLEVLVAAHARGVIHRDIKPQNLFIIDTGALKVLDFGIARQVGLGSADVATEVGTVLGTPAFLPPEQARGRTDEIDARSDLWAVGATAYTLLTGTFVHDAKTRTEQLGLAMLTAAPTLADAAPSLPGPLVEVIDRSLAYSRHERWSDASSMLAAIRWIRQNWSELSDPSLRLPHRFLIRLEREETGAANVDQTLTYSEPARPARPMRRLLGVSGAALAVVLGLVLVRGTSRRAKETSEQTPAPAPAPAVFVEPALDSRRTTNSSSAVDTEPASGASRTPDGSEHGRSTFAPVQRRIVAAHTPALKNDSARPASIVPVAFPPTDVALEPVEVVLDPMDRRH